MRWAGVVRQHRRAPQRAVLRERAIERGRRGGGGGGGAPGGDGASHEGQCVGHWQPPRLRGGTRLRRRRGF
eukprot:348160-Prorocentrum_minimum.AAC.1